jgi:ribosomal protein L3 glutamine methyltransferase
VAKPRSKPLKTPRMRKTSKTPPRELSTVLDFVRYAISRFVEAKLGFGQGTHDAVEEAIFLVCGALGLPIDRTDPFLPAQLTSAERRKIFALIEERVRRRMPAAYLLNRAYLQGAAFYIDERVIVPRSYLAEIIYGDLFKDDGPFVDPASVRRVLDLCTGSGCLAILACDIFPDARVDATDISGEALKVAEINVAEHALKDRVTLRQGDLFEAVGETIYDVILANPPYVTAKAVDGLPAEFSHEPRLALFGGSDGLDIVRRILAQAGKHLSPQGGLLCEVGRGRRILERDYPDAEFLWLDTAKSSGEVFWMTRAALKQTAG